jgi:DNA-binding NarL/FixJ family response regulator
MIDGSDSPGTVRACTPAQVSMENTPRIRILIADDHPVFRAGLAAIISTEPDLQVVAEAANGQEAIELYHEHRPDVLLMDLRMPVMDGVAATRALMSQAPSASIIVLTSYDGDENIYRALEAGARGYALKDMIRMDLLKMLRTVHAGRRSIPAPVAARIAEHTPRVRLTERELEVLHYAAQGLSNAEVAEKIFRTEATVKVHLRNIYHKLNVSDRTAAVMTALRRGFIQLD